MGGDLAPSLGGTEKKLRTKFSNVQTTFFRKKFPFYCQKFLMTFFSHRPYFVCLLPVSTVVSEILHIAYTALFLTKNLYFRKKSSITPLLVSSYFLAHPITLLLELLGDGCMGRPPHLKLGGPSPSSPKSLPISLCFVSRQNSNRHADAVMTIMHHVAMINSLGLLGSLESVFSC